jgi:hypothetical protein
MSQLTKAGFTAVTKDEFFAYIGPRDICVSIRGSGKSMHSVFETRSRSVVGEGHKGLYLLKSELVKS